MDSLHVVQARAQTRHDADDHRRRSVGEVVRQLHREEGLLCARRTVLAC